MKVKIKLVFAGMCMLALNFFAKAQDSESIRQKIHQLLKQLQLLIRSLGGLYFFTIKYFHHSKLFVGNT